MSKHGKVLVAMSGGLDSTVTAVMLADAGYEVIGITMKTWDYESSGSTGKETGCCSLDSINDARSIAVQHGIHHMILDIRQEFGNYVIDNFVDEYMSGRTPNPCVLCNTHIKWDALLKRAKQLDCQFIATGHYAQVLQEQGRYFIRKGLDATKDQSYVLWGLSQESLAQTQFPLGKYRKSEIREMAMEMGLELFTKKSESFEICFVPDNNYRNFLKHKDPGLESRLDGGLFLDTQGKVLGKHRGYPFYTIGQRKGLEIALGKPVFVTAIIPETNTVILGDESDLMGAEMMVSNITLSKYAQIPDGFSATTKIRYKDAGSESRLTQQGNQLLVQFEHHVKAITPGQSAVFYEGDDVIGGGHIMRQVN